MSLAASFIETRAVRIPEEGTVAVVSTRHVFVQDADILERLATSHTAPVMVARYPHGFIVSLLPSDEADEAGALDGLLLQGLSPSFRDLWKGMRDRGYALLQIDADGSVLAGYRVVR